MPKQSKRFVNPLLQPSTETPVETDTKPEVVPSTQIPTEIVTVPETITATSTETDTETYTSEYQHRKRGKQRFEATHERMTGWIDKRLKKAFLKLAKDEEVSQVELLNEAIADLLKKRGKL